MAETNLFHLPGFFRDQSLSTPEITALRNKLLTCFSRALIADDKLSEAWDNINTGLIAAGASYDGEKSLLLVGKATEIWVEYMRC